ncbi:PP2C family protein-serine/threonine phosphatase [Jidongwangia harbinensis]|uniref:PP2C family protein-serine/threonine phosphatase n=1 Tax=Jidongwangia harbinensis TaxID=2878561 RepID=UPI001CDA11FD|nr:SpoIIE family protein phosphatase [Jidongwangia harbinensis]MCA2216580.1 SpoIIE family protein phosphatase [Jidongwangia harbinensis]
MAPLEETSTTATVRQVLAAIPAGCSWLLPVHGVDGEIVDFRIAAASGEAYDIHGRGTRRVNSRLSELYPSMVGGPLWQMYQRVMAGGEPGRMPDFRYEEKRSGVVAESQFDVSVHRVLGGLLVWWQRVDEYQRRQENTELLASLAWTEYDLTTGASEWSPGMYRIFERDPSLGPMPRAEQGAAVLAEDRGIAETAWQTLDSGAKSDVTVRFHIGGSVKHLRILSDVARDGDGAPVKIYAVVQDVTAREESRTAIERLSEQLRTRTMTALAEHRLAGQLQNLIQPVPREPFRLAGLEAMVSYTPAASAVKVGGDWYHADTLPDGQVVLAVGDVAGHGLEAASGMAHLRFSLIGWLSIGIRDPGTLIRHMNRLCVQLAITGTAVVALYDPAARSLSWARAGHMPPLLGRAGRSAELDRPVGLLLGADAEAAYPVVVASLGTGDLVLFYTDGLVERLPSGPADLLDRVMATLSSASADSGEQTLTRLRDSLDTPSPDDDTCLLAVRVLP